MKHVRRQIFEFGALRSKRAIKATSEKLDCWECKKKLSIESLTAVH